MADDYPIAARCAAGGVVRAFLVLVGQIVVLVGIFLLVSVVWRAIVGSLTPEFTAQSQISTLAGLYRLLLSLPVPFHVISVGLILQLRRLSPPWARFARFAVVGSGCWLGVSMLVRILAS